MDGLKVIIIDDTFAAYEEEQEVLQEAGVEPVVFKGKLKHNQENYPLICRELFPLIADADALLVNLLPIPAELIGRLSRCRVISRYGVGYDNVDIEAATRQGIWVTNVPDYCIEEVAEHTLALLLGCARKLAYKDKRVRAGGWHTHAEQPISRVQGKVLGIIGFGAVGKSLCKKVSGLDFARILAYDPFVDKLLLEERGVIPVSLETLLKESDFVSVHVPLNKDTCPLLDQKALALMKPTAILLNTSRGKVIDEKALLKALQDKALAYAGLDVFAFEPLDKDSPLSALNNVILSDHCAYYSLESIRDLKTKAALNVLAVLQGREPFSAVNHINHVLNGQARAV